MLIGNNLSERYQNKTLISKLDICIASKKVNVFDGPNGMGKSTLIKAL